MNFCQKGWCYVPTACQKEQLEHLVTRVNPDHSPDSILPERGRKVWVYMAGGKCTETLMTNNCDTSLKLIKLISRLQWYHMAWVSMTLKVIYLVSEPVSGHQHPHYRIQGSHWKDGVWEGNLDIVKSRLLFEFTRWDLATDTTVLGSQGFPTLFSSEVVCRKGLRPWDVVLFADTLVLLFILESSFPFAKQWHLERSRQCLFSY